MLSKIFPLLILSVGARCIASEPVPGKTVAETVQMLRIELKSGSMITEPPAVVRGFHFILKNGDEVQLFIERGQVPLTFKGGSDLSLYPDLEVKGIRRVSASGEVSCMGSHIVWFYQCNKP